MTDSEIERILIIRTGGIGDLILSLPLFVGLRRLYPHAWFEVMGNRSRLELLEGRYYADRICSIEQPGMASFFLRDGVLHRKLAEYLAGFDLVVSLLSDPDGLFSDNLRRAGVKKVLPIAPSPPDSEAEHYSHYLFSQLDSRQSKGEPTGAKLFLTESDREYASRFWKEQGLGGVLAIHPGSGSPRKMWRPEGFAEVANWAAEKWELEVLLVCGPADHEAVSRVAELIKPKRPLILADYPLTQLAALLHNCRAFVGNDSGITHLASAVDTPVVAVFGPSDPRVWRPLGKRTVFVNSRLPCSPCIREKMRGCPGSKCLDSITAGEVCGALKKNFREF